jgi:HEAT repeat protein
VDTHVRILARQQTDKAVKALIDALDDENSRVRVAAAEALLDRGWGKPAQALAGADGEGPAELVVRWTSEK